MLEQEGDIDTTGIELEKKFINTYVSKSTIRLKTGRTWIFPVLEE